MPTNYDFTHLNVDTAEIDITGWKDVVVEFAMSEKTSQEQVVYWRVKGTEQTFRVYMSFLLEYYDGTDYEKYFKDLLTTFRKDYKTWEDDEFEEGWMQEYKEQFQDFII